MENFDIGFGAIPPVAAFGSIAMDGDEYVRCNKCEYGGCDVRVSGCGCTLHARCIELNQNGQLSLCPQCQKSTQGLVLFPMSFREIDEAHRTTASLPAVKNRGRKRKGGAGSDGTEDKAAYITERRTGRWTNEEMAYCDKLISKFISGELPIPDNVKLNEFLGSMLKSKQSRLTKKMKNAKLSSKTYKIGSGFLTGEDAREFSELEESFFQSIQDMQERAEIKFHMQKEWRELLSQVCAKTGQPLDADGWLSSVEEMDRRASQARDAARMAKRKLMIGVALRTDSKNPDNGVFIERTEAETRAVFADLSDAADMEEEILNMLSKEKSSTPIDVNGKSSLLHSAPFLGKVIAYMQRHAVPFEHVDLWVPSFVPSDSNQPDQSTCRLCYAGSATVDKMIDQDGKTIRDLTAEEHFNLYAFGDYSQKFSFDVGCGLPGRVYESGRPTWEQSVHNAPHNHFERCGGALQWGIKTVVGIPIASPNVGRIVVTIYSCFDRAKDEDLVTKLSEEFTRLMPCPKWKLVVDIGDVEETATAPSGVPGAAYETVSGHKEKDDILPTTAVAVTSGANLADSTNNGFGGKDRRIDEVIALLGECMPSDPSSPFACYLPGFMSLRLLLLRQTRSSDEEETIRTMLDSFTSYSNGGRERLDIAVMLARDFMFLTQQQFQNPPLFSLGQSLLSGGNPTGNAGSGLSVFGLPSISSSLQNSPALTPIPLLGSIDAFPESIDALSIVSN